MSSGTVHLPFHDRRIDDCAAIIHGDIVQNPGNKRVALDLHHCDVQLRSVGHGEIAIFLFLVRHLEGGAPDVTAVEGDVVHLGRQDRAVHVDDVGQAPVIDGFAAALGPKLGPLCSRAEFDVVFVSLQNKGG